MASDIERIRRDVSLSETAAQYGVALERDGREWVAPCPFHDEKTASFTVFTGKDNVERFHCFGCGAAGDVLDFVQKIKGLATLPEVIAVLGGSRPAGENIRPVKMAARDIYADITPLDPTTEIEAGARVKLYNPKRAGLDTEWGSFVPSMVFPYRRLDGSLLGYVLRHELGKDGKETPMVMWVRLANGNECWCRFPFPKPRPLYGLEHLGDARQVFVVEGEKKADKLRAVTGRACIAWAGGVQGVKHTDWSPIAGRNVVIWPDADEPGIKCADEIAHLVTGLNCKARVLDVMGEVT
jgi:hypothetical protein